MPVVPRVKAAHSPINEDVAAAQMRKAVRGKPIFKNPGVPAQQQQHDGDTTIAVAPGPNSLLAKDSEVKLFASGIAVHCACDLLLTPRIVDNSLRIVRSFSA